jgi:flagellin-like protein
MKKMWKLNNKAVSPVIATILMVAITVVLAAVLYVMVMGFGGGGNDDTPTGSLTYEKTDSLTYRITVASIGAADVLRTDCTLYVDGNATTLTPVGSATYMTAGTYADVVFDAPGTYTVTLQYGPTGNNIASVTITATA